MGSPSVDKNEHTPVFVPRQEAECRIPSGLESTQYCFKNEKLKAAHGEFSIFTTYRTDEQLVPTMHAITDQSSRGCPVPRPHIKRVDLLLQPPDFCSQLCNVLELLLVPRAFVGLANDLFHHIPAIAILVSHAQYSPRRSLSDSRILAECSLSFRGRWIVDHCVNFTSTYTLPSVGTDPSTRSSAQRCISSTFEPLEDIAAERMRHPPYLRAPSTVVRGYHEDTFFEITQFDFCLIQEFSLEQILELTEQR